MHPEALLSAAVTNNALWCDAVCRSHGYQGEFSTRLARFASGHAIPHHDRAGRTAGVPRAGDVIIDPVTAFLTAVDGGTGVVPG